MDEGEKRMDKEEEEKRMDEGEKAQLLKEIAKLKEKNACLKLAVGNQGSPTTPPLPGSSILSAWFPTEESRAVSALQ